MPTDNNNSKQTAENLSAINATRGNVSFNGTLESGIDSTDFLRFTLDPSIISTLSLSVTGNVGLTLLKEVAGTEDLLTEAVVIPNGFQTNPDNISLFGLTAGDTYFLNVQGFASGINPYSVNLRAFPNSSADLAPNDTLTTASTFTSQNFSIPDGNNIINGVRVVQGSLNGGDVRDFYRFDVNTSTPSQFFAAVIPQAGGNANLSLISDTNGNRIVDPGDTLVTSALAGTDSITSELLPGGTYFLDVNKPGAADLNYQLTSVVQPIQKAQMSVTLERITGNPSDFDDGSDKADFYAEVKIDGKSEKTNVVENVDDLILNRTVTKEVGKKRLIPIEIRVSDNDQFPNPDDDADINSGSSARNLSLTYDTITGQISGTGISTTREGQTIVAAGTSDDSATLRFKVNYDSFLPGSSAATANLQRLSTLDGTEKSDIGRTALTGTGESGIVSGFAGNDKMSAMGGNDVLLGGDGNDILNGGVGDDILFGGNGNDTLNGNGGKDTFVMSLNTGIDSIIDFGDGIDKIGLANRLSFDMLNFVQDGNRTIIGMGDQQLAIVNGIQSTQLDASDFVTVDFTSVKGKVVPYAMA